nr:hypothetical protein [Tanacetum cinerariifolium]
MTIFSAVDDESNDSSTSYAILLDTETEPIEALPSPDYDAYTKEDGAPLFTLPTTIEAAFAEEIATPPCERYRSSFLSSPSPSPPPSPSCKRYKSPSLPPSQRVAASTPFDMLPPHKRFRMTSPHPGSNDEATAEAIPARLRRMYVRAGRELYNNLCDLGDRIIFEELQVKRVESIEEEIVTLRAKVKFTEQRIKVMRDSLIESQIRMEDPEARLQQSKFRDIAYRARLRRLEDILGM